MINKNYALKKKIRHLEEAMFENRVASANDCTGLMITPPESEDESKNISNMLKVPTSVPPIDKK